MDIMNTRLVSIIVLVLFFMPSVVFAQEPMLPFDAVSPTPIPSSGIAEYSLPYPGLLPDSPLYRLKVWRDVIQGFLISDPVKAAEFNLLQADKRMSGAVALAKKRPVNEQLVVETLESAHGYMKSAVGHLEAFSKQGNQAFDVQSRSVQALQAYQQIVADIQKQLPKEQQALVSIKQDFASYQKRVELLQKEK